VKLWAQTELGTANTIYKQEFAGMGFKHLGPTDLTGPEESTATVQHAWAPPGCTSAADTAETLERLHDITGDLDANQLNVFYVQTLLPFSAAGVWCGEHDPDGPGANTILLASHHYAHTLAHEIGHAVLNSAHHAENLTDGFTDLTSSDNLMRVGDLGGTVRLTIGQLFRANLDAGSAINRHHARNGPTTSCDAAMAGNSCPPLTFDVRPR
jgi:hypothetical protein